MFTIDNISNNKTDIVVIKGNTFRERIRIMNDERLNYIPEPGDKITFSVFSKYGDSSPIYSKVIPYDKLILELKANETGNMKIGDYVYTVRLKLRNGDVDDFIHGSFIVKGMID